MERVSTSNSQPFDVLEIECVALNKRMQNNDENIYLLDVREHHEWNQFNIGGALIPMSEIGSRIKEIPSDKDIVVICKSGYRSFKVAEMLVSNQAFKRVFNLKGGLSTWVKEIGE